MKWIDCKEKPRGIGVCLHCVASSRSTTEAVHQLVIVANISWLIVGYVTADEDLHAAALLSSLMRWDSLTLCATPWDWLISEGSSVVHPVVGPLLLLLLFSLSSSSSFFWKSYLLTSLLSLYCNYLLSYSSFLFLSESSIVSYIFL